MHAAVRDFIVDCLQNSIEAGASLVELEIEQKAAKLDVLLRDNGCGMDPEELAKAQDPFYTDGKKHRHRKVGLGLPFLIQAVDLAAGNFSLLSEKGKGTTLRFAFDLRHVDSPPLGRLEDAFLQGLMFPGDYELVIHRKAEGEKGADEYTLRKSELLEVLGSLEDSGSLLLAKEYLRNQEEELVKTTI